MTDRVSPPTVGYSGTPLGQKLGIKAGSCVLLIGAPPTYADLLQPLPDRVCFVTQAGPAVDLAQVFVTRRSDLVAQLHTLRAGLRPDAAIWVSWPKKASKQPTDITEDSVREEALPMGLVDVKVCAVDAVWSGLKLVLRKALR